MLPALAAFMAINAGPIAKAIQTYTNITGISVMYPYVDLKHTLANEVECDCGPVEGMRRLLWGTHAWITGIERDAEGRIDSITLIYRPCLFKPAPEQSWEDLRCET